MKYQSELIKEIVDKRGHNFPSLHYQSECVESWIEEARPSYPKLCDYEGEWLNYINNHEPIGEFPYETLKDVTEAIVNNVIPYAYKSAILKGSTKYRDIDTGEVLDAFEDGRNLELVSVRMPVLTTTGKNLFDKEKFIDKNQWSANSSGAYRSISLQLEPNTVYTMTRGSVSCNGHGLYVNVSNHRNSPSGSHWWLFHPTGNYNKQTSFTTNETGIIYFNSSTVDLLKDKKDLLNEVQLEKGNTVTSYEPFKSNILSTPEDLELRGIGDVKDTLDLMTGEVVERIGEIVLDGSESWVQRGEILTNTMPFATPIKVANNDTNIMCDKFKNSTGWSLDEERIWVDNTALQLHISKTKATNINELKTWLSNNNVRVNFKAPQESIKTVDLTITNQDGEKINRLIPIEGTMHLITSGENIKPLFTGEIPVEAITQNLASFIEEG